MAISVATIDGADVAKHSTRSDCWTVIHGKVWNVSDFVDEHPGGASLILKVAGRDGTSMYDTVHGPELVAETLGPEKCLGSTKPGSLVKKAAADAAREQEAKKGNNSEPAPPPATKWPPLGSIVNVDDFEKVAQRYLTAAGWAYYSSGAEDELSLSDTRRLFRRVTFRPRVLRRVEPVSAATRILGVPSALPFYISPTGLGRYAHPDAEPILGRAAGQAGILYCMPTAIAHEGVFAARARPDQPLFLQLYANRERAGSEALVRRAERLGAAAVFLTVDSPVLGRRERDDRVKVAEGEDLLLSAAGVAKTSSRGLLNPLLTWEDVDWLRGVTRLPVVIKGVQTVEDAVLAHARGVQGVVLSNHGGRSLDTAQAPLLTLLEIRRHAPHLLSRDVRPRFQVFVDGGVRRGTDVLKALALGASAVGIGRPFLYALTAEYGEAGVARLIDMLRAEIETSMALLGAASLDDLVPEMVNSERAENEMSRRVKL